RSRWRSPSWPSPWPACPPAGPSTARARHAREEDPEPLIPAPPFPVSYFWSFYGHSYYQGNFGTHGPAGRADSIMRSLFGLAPIAETKNHAMVGARATWNGNSQGGWTRLI